MVLRTCLAALTVGTLVAVGGLAGPAAAAPSVLAPVGAPTSGAHAHASVPGSVPVPADDPFYTPPKRFKKAAPGSILRSRQVTLPTEAPASASAYQLLVRTADSRGNPIATVSTVIVPNNAPTDGTRRLLSYQIAIDSLGAACNPSYELQTGSESDTTGLYAAVQYGWDVVITDYEGPEMALFAGPVTGHAVLDGIRAAEAYAPDGLTPSTEVAGWGYSGGGQASGWAAQLQPTYAPELNVVGWVAGDFAANLPPLIKALDGGEFSGFILGGAFGIARDYPRLQTLVSPAGMSKEAEIGEECLYQLVGENGFEPLAPYLNPGVEIYTNKISAPVLAANSMGAAAPTAPTLVQSGANDEIIPASQGEGINATWCALGAPIQFQVSEVPEHVVNDFALIPGSEQWLQDRFDRAPFTSTC